MNRFEFYKILSTYDKDLIYNKTGIKCHSIRDIWRIAKYTYDLLDEDEKAQDYEDTLRDLSNIN